MKILTSIKELASHINEAERKQPISDDAFRESVQSWCLSPAIFGEAPSDPFSPEYKAFQLKIYEQLTHKEYRLENEETVFDFENTLAWPFPYGTKSARTVGAYLMSYGWLIEKMDLPAESRILEIGSGYGSLTIHLASMGYQVTCLDISAPLLDFVKARIAHLPQQVESICGDIATVEIEGTFDAVIFNASLHHSLEHEAVIQRMENLLTPDGIMVFTSEPIVDESSQLVPYPWGIRLDGLSVWSISQWGWLELGFQEAYFTNLLTKNGWKLKRHNLGISAHTDVWIAAKAQQNMLSASVIPQFQPHQNNNDLETNDLETNALGANDLGAEVVRLRKLVEGYEQGRFMRFMKWLKN